MGNKDKKGPFSFLSLNKSQSEWFADYLQGKNRNEETETRRREIIREAHSRVDNDKVTVCLKS